VLDQGSYVSCLQMKHKGHDESRTPIEICALRHQTYKWVAECGESEPSLLRREVASLNIQLGIQPGETYFTVMQRARTIERGALKA
jgi:hypothetical protein